MRSSEDIEQAIDRYGDIILRACSAFFPQRHDAEDAFQDTFVRYAQNDTAFNSEEHRKAWLIRVASNICKDRLRTQSHLTPLEEQPELAEAPQDERLAERLRIRQAMRLLTDDQRMALMLSAVEGYSAPEIASIMNMPVNTIYSHIKRGKKKLKEVLGDD